MIKIKLPLGVKTHFRISRTLDALKLGQYTVSHSYFLLLSHLIISGYLIEISILSDDVPGILKKAKKAFNEEFITPSTDRGCKVEQVQVNIEKGEFLKLKQLYELAVKNATDELTLTLKVLSEMTNINMLYENRGGEPKESEKIANKLGLSPEKVIILAEKVPFLRRIKNGDFERMSVSRFSTEEILDVLRDYPISK